MYMNIKEYMREEINDTRRGLGYIKESFYLGIATKLIETGAINDRAHS